MVYKMFYLLMSFYKVYTKGAFSFDFILKIICHLGWVHINLTLKEKHKIKYFIWLLFNSPTFLPSYSSRWASKQPK